jgi:hypothetical protein
MWLTGAFWKRERISEQASAADEECGWAVVVKRRRVRCAIVDNLKLFRMSLWKCYEFRLLGEARAGAVEVLEPMGCIRHLSCRKYG